MDPETDDDPTCDVVLKGGITSGVLYPTLLCELARRYRLVNVGGASAGAIAAVVAAAEYGRQHGSVGFGVLEAMPTQLGAVNAAGDTALMALFEPQPRTRPLMTVLRAVLRGRGVAATLLTALGVELGTSAGWWRVLLSAVPGVLVVVAALAGAALPWSVVLVALGVALTVLGLVAGTCWALARRLLTEVPANLLGVVDGSGSPSALTPWLARTIDEAAGRTGGPPVTFADLWGATDDDAKRACLRDRDRRRINLEVMTTDLGRARPQRLPMAADEWFFCEDEFRRLFPQPVVDAMVAAVDPVERTGTAAREHDLLTRLAAATGHRRLPQADLPVVVAARLSLSFPVLLSAVPLYRFDFSRAATIEALRRWRAWLVEHPDVDPADVSPDAAGDPIPLSRCWISDGGITSNLPVHFFDTPLPTRPTFLVNLRPADPNSEGPAVRLAENNRQGLQGSWTDLGDGPPTLGRFAAAIARTMQNWVDNAQMRMPGYRDRIVTIYLAAREGGMNLQMDGELIDSLGERGRQAAELLVARYADDGAAGWHNHRWVRHRSLMAMLERLFGQVSAVWTAEHRQGSAHVRGDARPDGAPRGVPPSGAGTALGAHAHGTGGRARRPVARARRGPGGPVVRRPVYRA
jgi:hypothetical protein